MEKLASYVDKEEKIWVKLIASAHVLERISQALCLCEAEKRMIHRIEKVKAVEVCDVTKEVASTAFYARK